MISELSTDTVFGRMGSSCPLGTCKLLQEHRHSCLPSDWGLIMDNCFCAKDKIYDPGLPLKVASLQQTWECKIVKTDGFYQYSCFLDRDAASWCFLLCHLPRILHRVFEFYLHFLKDVISIWLLTLRSLLIHLIFPIF